MKRTKVARRLRTTDESTPPDIATWTVISVLVRGGKGGEVPLSPDPRPRSSRVGINAAKSVGSGFVV